MEEQNTISHFAGKYSPQQVKDAIQSFDKALLYYLSNPHLAPGGILINKHWKFRVSDRKIRFDMKKFKDFEHREYYTHLLNQVDNAKFNRPVIRQNNLKDNS